MIAQHALRPLSVAIGLALCTALPVLAQVSVGNRLGASFARFKFTGTGLPPALLDQINKDTRAINGFTAGVPLEIRFTGQFAVQPELGYLLEGWTTVNGPVEDQLRLNYGQVNLLAKVTIGRGRLRAFAQAGPSWNKLLSVRSLRRFTGPDITIDDGTVHKDMDPFTPSAWSVVAGAGLAFQAGTVRLLLDYRYVHGVSSPAQDIALTDQNGTMLGTAGTEHQVHVVALGILLPLKPATPTAIAE